jgi:hypothetical protein
MAKQRITIARVVLLASVFGAALAFIAPANAAPPFLNSFGHIDPSASAARSEGHPHEVKPLAVVNMTLPAPALHEGVLAEHRVRQLSTLSPTTPYQTPDGMTIYISVSDYYVPDPATDQEWANFLGWLTHGSEMNGLLVFIITPQEIASVCGPYAAACYGQNQMFVAGEDAGGVPVEQAIAHEYGHHIALHRLNTPWPAVDWGPKRWATYHNVCMNAAKGSLFPGAETPPQYKLNPGEGWAEGYRRMNELRAGTWPDFGWGVVDPFFIPDATALQLINQDVTNPWSGPTVHIAQGRLRRNGVRRWKFSPYDGPMRATVTGVRGTTVSLVSRGKVVRGPASRVSRIVCGDPSVTVVVRSTRGGKFRLKVSEDEG